MYWLISVASLVGVWLNIRRRVACFWIWSVTNATWALADYQHGLPAQAALQLIYCGLSIYGIVTWSRRPNRKGR